MNTIINISFRIIILFILVQWGYLYREVKGIRRFSFGIRKYTARYMYQVS